MADCGCFGTALTLTNGQTLAKNIVLLTCAAILYKREHYLLRLISERNQWIVSLYSAAYIILLSIYSFHYLPVVDFTDFKEGTDLRNAYYLSLIHIFIHKLKTRALKFVDGVH